MEVQTTLRSTNTYFSPMITRDQAVAADIQSYRDPRPDWSLLVAETAPADSTTPRKIPTESDDREDSSSDSSERAEDDLDGADDWHVRETRAPMDDGGSEVTFAAAIVTVKSPLTSMNSFGEPVVLVAAETVSADTIGVDFRLKNEEDEQSKEVEDGTKEIEEGMQAIHLAAHLNPHGPHGGKPKCGVANDGRGQEPSESTDVEDQPYKYSRPDNITNGSYDFTSSLTGAATPRMQFHGQSLWHDPPQTVEPTCQSFPPLSTGYPIDNGYIFVGNQTDFRQPLHNYSCRYNVRPENTFPTTNNRYPNTERTNENYRATFADLPSTNVALPSYMSMPGYYLPQRIESLPMPTTLAPAPYPDAYTEYSRISTNSSDLIRHYPRQDNDFSSLRTNPTTIQSPILIQDAQSAAPVTATSDLELIYEWVNEQPETRSPETVEPGINEHYLQPYIGSIPTSAPSFNSEAYAPYLKISTDSSDPYGIWPNRIPANVSPPAGQLPTAPSPSGSLPHSRSSSLMETSPRSTAPGSDSAADVDVISRNSPGSDNMISDHGSVANSPSSVSEDGVTILIGDDTDADRMSQIDEARRFADSIQELALVSQDPQGDTPLHVAMIDDQWYLAESLLRRLIRDDLLKRIVNVKNKLQQTPLCLAVICNKPEIVETLVENGADVNVHLKASDDYLGAKFCQPLHLASSRGHLWKMTLKKLLRASNIDLDAFNSDGKSALHCAVEGHGRSFRGVTINCNDTLRMLAERGANLNQPDCGHEKTPLHYAIERRDVALVQRLLHLAMSSALDRDLCSVAKMLEAKTGNGNTALHLAASVDMDTTEHKKLIQQLMSKGADPSSKNSDGFLPRELTKNRAIVELLKGRTASGRSPNTDKKRNL